MARPLLKLSLVLTLAAISFVRGSEDDCIAQCVRTNSCDSRDSAHECARTQCMDPSEVFVNSMDYNAKLKFYCGMIDVMCRQEGLGKRHDDTQSGTYSTTFGIAVMSHTIFEGSNSGSFDKSKRDDSPEGPMLDQVEDGQVIANGLELEPETSDSNEAVHVIQEIVYTGVPVTEASISWSPVSTNYKIAEPLPTGGSLAAHARRQVAAEAGTEQGSAEQASDNSTVCKAEGQLMMSLIDGVLRDAKGRTGYIASNGQLQFDEPPQENAFHVSGFGIKEGALSLDGSNRFWSCASSDFHNIYDRQIATYCEEVILQIVDLSDCGAEEQPAEEITVSPDEVNQAEEESQNDLQEDGDVAKRLRLTK